MGTLANPWPKHIVNAYYYATWPLRRWRQSWALRHNQIPISVLFYHRVADSNPNEWTISNGEFIRQMNWMRERFDMLSLAEAQQRLREGNQRPAVCITFDDGYAENCEQALPWLISHKIPVTYFVTSDNVLHNKPFPHDVEAGQALEPNTPAQLRSLAKAGVQIGSHTRSHPNFGEIFDEQQVRDEVIGSRDDLEGALGCAVNYFAFPFGWFCHLSPVVFRIAREAGFWGVCSAYGGYNVPGEDPFHIQRLHGDPAFERVRNWLTISPRMMRNTKRYRYEEHQEVTPQVAATCPQREVEGGGR